MASDVRPGDADRDRAVRDLTKHCGDGRLTLDELEDRIAEVYAATTRAELDHALRELPRSPAVVPPSRPPIRERPSAAPVRGPVPARAPVLDRRRAGEIALRIHLTIYLSVIALLTAIWAMTMFGGYYWPIWTAMPWGVALAVHAGVHKAVWAGEPRR